MFPLKIPRCTEFYSFTAYVERWPILGGLHYSAAAAKSHVSLIRGESEFTCRHSTLKFSAVPPGTDPRFL